MKLNYTTPFLVLLLSACSTAKYSQDLPTQACRGEGEINSGYSKAENVRTAMQGLVDGGVPGAVAAVYTADGWWIQALGYAKIEDKTPMQTCHLQYLQSISKTYLAVAVLKLYEQGRVDLDAPFGRYLPEKYSKYVSGKENVSVRMLLNHTSGIPEYNFDPGYVSTMLQHPDRYFVPEDFLKTIEGKPLTFPPGSKYSYRNTNFLLLALMTDAITGDHAKFISETIFAPLGLTQTFYRHEPGYINYPMITNSYWDRYSDGIVENVSQMQRMNVSTLIGDDGIVTTAVDAVKFLKGLVEGKLLSEPTLAQMKNWVKDTKGNSRYGLGLAYISIAGQEGFGHSGGGIGAGCELYYFPGKNTYVFIGINLGTVTDSPLHKEVGEAREKFYKALL